MFITIKNVRPVGLSLEIVWSDGDLDHIAMMYRRGDQSWLLDPETRQLGEEVVAGIQAGLLRRLLPPAKPKEVRKKRPQRREVWYADKGIDPYGDR